jgi:ferrochelatase
MRDDGVQRALAFVTSAYSSYSSCRQYLDDIDRARLEVGPGAPFVDKIRQFYDHPGFIEPMARNVAAARASLPASVRDDARLVFTAHSVPVSLATSSAYVPQLLEAARLVAQRTTPAGRDSLDIDLVWQSRSGPPQVPWLEPDISDHLDALAARDVAAVIVVPIGFVSDHMEVVYDLDVVAADRARAVGLPMARAATVGTDPQFVAMIRELIDERLDPGLPRRGLGSLGVRPDVCPPECCPATRR